MKKYLKNANLFIITLVLTIIFPLSTKAANGCEGLDANQCRVLTDGTVIKPTGEYYIKTYRTKAEATKNTRRDTYFKVGDIGVSAKANGSSANPQMGQYYDKWNDLYCLDAQLAGSPNLTAHRFLLDTNTTSLKIKAFDAAVYNVLTKGASDRADYFSILTAIRAFDYTFDLYTDGATKYKNAWFANQTMAATWNSTSENYAKLKALGVPVAYVPERNGYSYSGTAVDKAHEYYENGLAAAVRYIESGVSGQGFEEVDKTENNTEVIGESDNQSVKKDVIHTIKLKGLNNPNSSFTINQTDNGGITFAEGVKYDGLTAYISMIEIEDGPILTKEEGSIEGAFGSNWVQNGWITKDEVTVKITVHFEGMKTSTNPNMTTLKCGQQPIKYTIEGVLNTGTADQGNYVATVWYSGEGSQRYVGVYESTATEGQTWKTNEMEVSLIDSCDCDDLIKACTDSRNLNSPECIELQNSNCGDCAKIKAACDIDPYSSECDEEKYAAVCDITCETDFSTFTCCDAADELIVSERDNHEVSILGPGPDNTKSDDIKACFVTKIDEQCKGADGNSCENAEGVKDQEENTYTLKDLQDNKYCTVSCKEDYIMTMPTAKLVNAGRYFTFKARVEGTKTCYTNTIDREQYNKDINDAQVRLVKAFNEYLRVKTAVDAGTDPISHSCCTECGGSYVDYKYDTISPFSYNFTENKNTGVVSIQRTVGLRYYDIEYGGTSCPCGDDSCTNAKGDPTCCYHICGYCKDGEEELLIARAEAAFEDAEKELQAAQENYKAILKEYDECSSWESEINYDTSDYNVYYDYDEKDYMNKLRNHIGEMNKSITVSDIDEWYCNSSINYQGYEDEKGELVGKNYEKCNNSTKEYNETSFDYIYCTEEKCKITPEDVSDARYKKVTSKIEASYKPKTLFYNIYPNGEITINKGNNTVALENKLPVALNRDKGIYDYTVNIKNLGEFYHIDPDDNLGRYVGSSTAVVAEDKLVYTCAYLVNIQVTEGWACDARCVGEDCYGECTGPGCDDLLCEGAECVADCVDVGCVYDSESGSSVFEKIVSLNNMFPNGTDSYNWTNDKGVYTKELIEENNQTIYEDKPILSLTIDPNAAKEFKLYNKRHEDDNGGYSNDTVTCEAKDGIEQIACFSDVITEILEGKYGDIVNENNSKIAEDGYRSVDSNYFKLWPEATDEDLMIGPAWY